MPGDEELDDEAWDPAKKEEAAGPPSAPNSKRATIRVPELSPSSQPPTVRPSQSQVDAQEITLDLTEQPKSPEDLPPKP